MPPKYRKPNRGRRAVPVSRSAPTGGLNGRDSFADMPSTDAFVLDNWFPGSTSVDTRGGCKNHVTGIGAPVESLELYAGGVGSKMLAFAGGKIFETTTPGAVGAPLLSGRVSNKVTTAMFSNAGGQKLQIYSGADAPLSYDGATLTALTITGLNAGTSQNDIFAGIAFKGRLLLAQTGQLGFYYLGIGAIQGAASFFDLGQQSLNGGSVAAIAAFSQESSGTGPQDYAVFATTEGEYIMYGGTDPSNAATWALVGRYYGPAPIGKKPWFKFRSDVYFITKEGILSFTQIRQMGQAQETDQYLTNKLGRNYTDVATYAATHGWCGFIYPSGGALVVNVPITSGENGSYVQFVMNTTTNSWCRYTNWNGITWVVMDGRMYFGTYDGRVALADEGFTDFGLQVQASARQAWDTFADDQGMGDADKQYHFATFSMQADGRPAISCALNVNFENDPPQFASATTPPEGALWDVALWDVALWAGAPGTENITVPVGKLGYTASLWVQAVSTASKIRWFATRIVFEKTRGVLLQ